MERLGDIYQAESKVFSDMLEFLTILRHETTKDIESLDQGIFRLSQIRRALYENLNQIQHEHLLLQGMRWLRDNEYAVEKLQWFWNPRQKGDLFEPDLKAINNNQAVLCAEATTSEAPTGVIDTRMRNTLDKLSKMQGRKFYFVRTKGMEKRAQTKVKINSWPIEVIKIELIEV